MYSGDLSISFFDFFPLWPSLPPLKKHLDEGELLCQLSDIFGLGPGSADTLRPECFCVLLPGIGQLCRAHPSLKTNYLVIHTVNTVCKYLPQDTTFGNVWYFFHLSERKCYQTAAVGCNQTLFGLFLVCLFAHCKMFHWQQFLQVRCPIHIFATYFTVQMIKQSGNFTRGHTTTHLMSLEI